MSPEQFLDLLEQRDLLAAEPIAQLRRQVASAPAGVSAQKIAQLLIKKGLLTEFQAKKLLGESSAQGPAPTQAKSAPAAKPAPQPSPPALDDEELGLLPLDDQPASAPRPEKRKTDVPPKTASRAQASAPLDEADLLVPLEEVAELTPLDELEPLAPPAGRAPATASGGGREPAQLADLLDDPLLTQTASAVGNPLLAAPAKPKSKGLGRWLAALSRPRGEPRKRMRENPWDSPLLLVGGGALVLMLLVGAALFFYLYRGTGDDMYRLAEEDYRAESYGQALDKFDKFLAKYPKHPKASAARVWRGLAQLRQATASGTAWQSALGVAQQVLPQIEGEPAFSEARPELSGLLPGIMAGLVEQAAKAATAEESQQHVDLAGEALKLINNSTYLPTSQRASQQARIESLQADLELVVRNINRDRELAAAVQQINEAAARRDTAEAYALRTELLKKYPNLEDHPDLRQAVADITAAERHKVMVSQQPLAAAQDEPPAAWQFRAVLAWTRGQSAPSLRNHVVFVLARGAAYGLRADTGQVLWRRYVGYQCRFHPRPVNPLSGSDALVYDAVHRQLMRVEAASGRLRWRLELDSEPRFPLVRDNRILVATAGGELLEVDPETGNSARRANLPQPLSVGPGLDEQRSRLIQPASQSSLYLLNEDSLECDDVYYLGHAAGSVVVPPVVTAGHVVVAENRGMDFAVVHFLSRKSDTGALQSAVDPPRVEGRIHLPLIASGRQVLAVTDRGAIYVWEIDPADPKRAVREVARSLGSSREPLLSYPLLDEGQLWVGDRRLTRYEVQPSRGQLARKWINDDLDTFVGPLQMFADVIFHVRQRKGAAGATVSAIRVDAGRDPRSDGERIWQTDLGMPPAGEPLVDLASRKILSVTAGGALFAIDADGLRSGGAIMPATVLELPADMPLLERRVDLDDQRMVLAPLRSSSHVALCDPADAPAVLRLLALPFPSCDGAPPVAFGKQLLVAGSTGSVALVDPTGSGPRIHPFQPPLAAGERPAWQRPAVLDGAPPRLAVADQTGRLYLVGVSDQPQPHLAALAQNQLQAAVVAPLASLGATIYVAQRGEGADLITAVSAEKLSPQQTWPLTGRVAWGPQRIADLVLVATDDHQLVCLDGGDQPRWQLPLEFGPLAGRPLAVGQELVCCSSDGTIWRLDAATGKGLAHLATGEALGSGPVAFAKGLLASAADGTVLVVPIPE